MSPAIGIDLGTTNSAVATVIRGQSRIIERATGQRLLPSLVGIKEDGTRVVGEEERTRTSAATTSTTCWCSGS